MGFILLVLMAALLAAMLWFLKVRGPVLTLSAAVILFGCAGYALQGRPELGGSPRSAAQRAAPTPLAGARHALTGQFDYADTWLNIADALASRGRTEDAAKLLQTQVKRHPGDYKLWLGLGNALADHSRALSPAARFAFMRSAELAPGHPAPRFFLGLAEARSGNPAEAAKIWRDVLADAPADVSWRPIVENGLLLVEQGAPLPTTPPSTNQAGS